MSAGLAIGVPLQTSSGLAIPPHPGRGASAHHQSRRNGSGGSSGGSSARLPHARTISSTCSGGCIPADGDCAGISNATAEHIHVRPYQSADGSAMWPLSSSAGWFPKTLPWGPERRTGSANITLRHVISWGTWADGVNFHGGHHNVLIEQCQMSFTGDDPFGLWPSSADAAADAAQCQQNIVLRNNTARYRVVLEF